MLNTIAGLLGAGVPGTDYESISTTTVGAGGAATVTFSSISSAYSHLQIRVMARCSAAGSDREGISIMMNSDNTANYAAHFLINTGAAASSSGASGYTGSGNNAGGSSIITGATSAANIFGVTIIDILDYANTNKNKVTRSLNGQDQNNTSGRLGLTSGLWLSTSAITSLTFTPTGGSFTQYSSFALYGIK
jgi:flagellin